MGNGAVLSHASAWIVSYTYKAGIGGIPMQISVQLTPRHAKFKFEGHRDRIPFQPGGIGG